MRLGAAMRSAAALLLAAAGLRGQGVPSTVDYWYPNADAPAPLNTKILVHVTCCEAVPLTGVSLVDGGGTVMTNAGERMGSGTGQWVVLTPPRPLSPQTSYTIRVQITGRPLITKTFTAGTANDTTPPVVVGTEPADGSDAAFRVPGAAIRFSEPMDPTSFRESQPLLTNREYRTPYPPEWVLGEPAVLRLASSPLELGFVYRVTYPGKPPRDLAGNEVAGPLPDYVFTTYPRAPKDGPRVVATQPVAGETGVPTNNAVLVQFDRPVPLPDAGVFQLSSADDPGVELKVEAGPGVNSVVLRPQALLRSEQEYTLRTAGLWDAYGAKLAAQDLFRFTTGRLPESRSMNLVRQPSERMLQVRRLQWRFSRAVSAVGLPRLERVRDMAGLSKETIDVRVSADGLGVEAEIPGPGIYRMQGPVYDRRDFRAAGYFSAPLEVSSVGEDAAPRVVTLFPSHPTEAAPPTVAPLVDFDEPVQAFQADQVSLWRGEERVAIDVSLVGARVTLRPRQPLEAGEYRVEVLRPADLQGQAGEDVAWSFRVGAAPTEPFRMESFEPAQYERGVDVHAPIVIRFNRPPNPAQVRTLGRVSAGASGSELRGNWKFEDNLARFEPDGGLPGETMISWGLGRITDFAGQFVQGDASGWFWTAKAPAGGEFRVERVRPAAGEMALRGAGAVSLEFSEAADPTTVTSDNIVVLLDGKWDLTNVSYDYARQRAVVQVSQSGKYQVFAGSGVRSLSGVPLTPFSTEVLVATVGGGTSPPTGEQPEIRSTIPENTARLAGTEPIVLYFHRAMDRALAEECLSFVEDARPLPGRMEWTPDSRALTFYPSTARRAGSTVYVAFSHVPLGGRSVEKYSFQGAAAPGEDPVVWSLEGYPFVLPSDGAVEVRFDRDRAAGYVRSAVFKGGHPSVLDVPLEISVLSPRLVRFRPAKPLPPHQFYHVAAKTEDGEIFSGGFETGTYATESVPRLIVGPTEAMGPAPLNGVIWVQSGVQLNRLRLQVKLIVDGEAVGTKATFEDMGLLVVIRTQGLLRGNARYRVELTGLEDLAGHALPDRAWTFQTGAGPVHEPAQQIAWGPRELASPDTTVWTEFDQPVIARRAWLRNLNMAPADFRAGFEGTPMFGTTSFSADGRRLIHQARRPWPTGSTVHLYADYSSWTGGPAVSGPFGSGFEWPLRTSREAPAAAPRVEVVSPPQGASEVPINAQIQARFAEVVAGTSLQRIRLESEGEAVPARAALESDGRTVTVTALRPLAGNRTYTVTVEEVRDAKGVAMSGSQSWGFHTGTSAWATSESAVVRPPYGEEVEFTLHSPRRLNVLSIMDGAVTLQCEQATRALGVRTGADESTVILTLRTAPMRGTSCTVQASNLRDLAGNPVRFQRQITLGAERPAGGPPRVQYRYPPEGEPLWWGNAVALVFDRPVTLRYGTNGVKLWSGGELVGVRASLNGDANLLTILPVSYWVPGKSYELEIQGVMDEEGNEAEPVRFTVVAAESPTIDSTVLRLLSSTPANGAVGVPPESPVILEYSLPVIPDQGFSRPTLSATIGGTYQNLSGLLRSVYEGTRLRLIDGGLPAGVQLTAGATVAKASGYASRTSSQISFATAASPDKEPPVAESIEPPPGSVLPAGLVYFTFRFSEPVMVVGQVAEFFAKGGRIPGENAVQPLDGDRRTVRLSFRLPAGVEGTLTLSPGVQDLAGNRSEPRSFAYSTVPEADAAALRVESYKPMLPSGAPVDVPVELTFNQAMERAALEAAVRVWDGLDPVPVTLESSADGKTWRLQPAVPWRYNSLVRVEVAQEAYSVLGTMLGSPFTFQFLTVADPAVKQAAALAAIAATAGAVDLRYYGELETLPEEPFGLRLGQRRVPGRMERMSAHWVRIVPDEPLDPAASYHLMAGPGREYPLRIRGVDKQGRATRAQAEPVAHWERGGMIRVLLNGSIQPFALEGGSVKVLDARGVEVRHTVDVGEGGGVLMIEVHGEARPEQVVIDGRVVTVQREVGR